MSKVIVPMNNLARNIRFHMNAKGWSASELARRADVPKQFIADVLRKRTPRNLTNLKKIALALGLLGGIDELVFGEAGTEKKRQTKGGDLVTALLDEQGDGVWKGHFELTLKRLKD